MEPLSLNTFIGAVRDVERTQFEVLNALKHIHTNFHQNKIYPDLSALIQLYDTLQHIAHNAETLESLVPKRLKELDVENQSWLHEPSRLKDSDFDSIRDLIVWALPHIQRAIEEGKTMFEFVDDNLAIEVVGILPSYLQEGYFFIPDNCSSQMHLIKYEVSIFTNANERYRSLKTTHIKSVTTTTILQPAQTLKHGLIEEFPEMPNPATFAFATDLEFPFQETMLPVAKRRLLRRLYS
jgi:hypothetical protein